MRRLIRDHPRVCGEKAGVRVHQDVPQGSPPRVRGKGSIFCHREVGGGITPACAGKSYSMLFAKLRKKDHPRVCGEKFCDFPLQSLVLGSPPRVRGKVSNGGMQSFSFRITPACAGKSSHWSTCPQANRDHPRVCGEKVSGAELSIPVVGSPPRVRGKEIPIFWKLLDGRITPACAGKRADKGDFVHITEDHPRVCGEKPELEQRRLRGRGSPPRVRGKD